MSKITRRTVVNGAGAAVMASAAGAKAGGAVVRGMIDVHAHFLPPIYKEVLARAGLTALDGGMPIPEWSEEAALGVMDSAGISGALLSVSSPFLTFLSSSEEKKVCRQVNIAGADIRTRHPDRFGVLSILPLQDIQMAREELVFCLDELGVDGVALPTNVDGLYLGNKKFEPLFSVLNERGVTCFVHPTSPCCFEAFNLGLPAPMLEFPFETTRTMVDLVLSRRLSQYPNIEFIVSHAGGVLPFLSQRIAGIGQLPALGQKQMSAFETMSAMSKFNYDLALSATGVQFSALKSVAPVTNILFGSDYPFTPEPIVKMSAAAIGELPMSADEMSMVRYSNAARLFPRFAKRCCH
ncbi:amidohydrolase family protein [Hirschia baltica]|uniref:amidohydrolase family protein n=1 Tax=Hirschia baltica TaxID=2724 RepID=UPI0011EA61EA|nr:amidohydrolase family protein [Hirschia baltica]